MTIYEYILITQPRVIFILKKMGLLLDRPVPRVVHVSRREILELMRHDRWKRVRGVIRQSYPGKVAR